MPKTVKLKMQLMRKMSMINIHVYASAEITELSGLEPVSLVIKKGRVKWFGHAVCKDTDDCMKHSTGSLLFIRHSLIFQIS